MSNDLTYRDLFEKMKTMSEEQLDMKVVIYDADEDWISVVEGAAVVGEEDAQDCRPYDGLLATNHPYLILV